MKRISFVLAFVLIISPCLSHKAMAQEDPFIVFEYMHVKPGNGNEYLQVENIWRQIHLARQKAGNILGWSVWEVVAPYKSDAPYQFVVLTVYPHFSNFLNPDSGIGFAKVFPNITKDSIGRIFSKTGEVREMVQRDIFAVDDHVGIPNGDSINYLMATYVKVTPEKEKDFHAFVKDHWKPVVEKVVNGGYAKFWWYGSMLFPNGENDPYNHIMVVNWRGDNMFDTEPPFAQYQKDDPAAFDGYKTSTRAHRVLLHKVVSLKGLGK